MMNVTQHTAWGGSWFVIVDEEDELITGPAVRYRRWMGHAGSLDLSLGTPVKNSAVEGPKPGSILGSIKYNPVHWFGVAVRPEYQRRPTEQCVPEGQGLQCTEHTTNAARVYAGMEFGWFPGLGLYVGGIAFLAFLAVLLAGAN